MAIGLIGSIAPEDFAQANPFLVGYSTGQNIINQEMQNQAYRAQLPYAGPMAQAQLAYAQAQTPYLNAATQNMQANAGYTGANTNVLQQTTPYIVNQARIQQYPQGYLQNVQALNQAVSDPQVRKTLIAMGMPENQINQIAGQPSQVSSAQQNAINQGALPDAGIYPQGVGQVQGAQGTAPINPNTGNSPYLAPPIPTGNTQPLSGNVPPQAAAPQAYAGSSLQNLGMFGSPYNPFQLNALKAQMQQQATLDVDTYNKMQTGATQDAINSNNLNNLADEFMNNYTNSTYKGSLSGNLPSRGIESMLIPGNLSAEQATDAAATALSATMAKAYFPGRVTNADMMYVQRMKPGRNMDPEAADQLVNSVKALGTRVQEYPQFITAAKNMGLSPQLTQTLWTQYINQRPVFDYKNDQVRKNFQGSWNDFLSQNSINAVSNGMVYVPKPTFDNKSQFKSWYAGLTPQQQQYVTQNYGGNS